MHILFTILPDEVQKYIKKNEIFIYTITKCNYYNIIQIKTSSTKVYKKNPGTKVQKKNPTTINVCTKQCFLTSFHLYCSKNVYRLFLKTVILIITCLCISQIITVQKMYISFFVTYCKHNQTAFIKKQKHQRCNLEKNQKISFKKRLLKNEVFMYNVHETKYKPT